MAVIVSAAVITAIEVGTLAAALTAITYVGTAMTVVGVITKSKELTKVGGVMSLVGGIGGLVNGAVSGLAAGAAAEGAGAAGLGDAAAAAGAESTVAGMAGDAVTGFNAAGTAPIIFDGAGAAAQGAAGAIDSSAGGLIGSAQATGGASSSLDSFLSQGATPASASGMSGIVPDASGTISTGGADPFSNQYGLPSGGATDKVLGATSPADFQGSMLDTSVYQPGDVMAKYGTANVSAMDSLKNTLGSAWNGLGAQGKAELLKSVLAMPGGVQNQKNAQAALAMQQQRVNQTSYSSQVPTFGIINKAQKG